MKNFVVLYHMNEKAVEEAAKATPEEREATMEPWFSWAKRCGDKLVDFGTPLMGGVRLNKDGSTNPSEKGVFGYSILKTESLEDAKSLMEGHPHMAWSDGCDIEIHESMAVPSA